MKRVFYLEKVRDKKWDKLDKDTIVGLRYRGYTTPDGPTSNTNTNNSSTTNDPSVAGTLADLKKHRSQNRSSVSPENGSLLSAQSLGSLTTGPNGQPLELSLVSTTASSDHPYSSLHGNGNGSLVVDKSAGISTVSSSGNGSLVMGGGTAATAVATVAGTETGTPSGTLNKFSGNTSDVVSDSTRSRRCCVVM